MGTITPKQIQYLQTVRRQAGIDDGTYAGMKADLGVESTKDLTNDQFDKLLARIEGRAAPSDARGRKAYKPVHSSAKQSGMHLPPPAETAAMLSKIEAILADLKLPWSYADGMAQRMFGTHLLRWCKTDQVYKLLQALAMHQRRMEGGGKKVSQPAEDIKFHVKSLRSSDCPHCDGRKKEGQSFCYGCYKRLPEEMRKALYRRLGAGYEEAFEAAVKWLALHE